MVLIALSTPLILNAGKIDAGKRVDVFVSERFKSSGLTRSGAQKIIRNGAVLVNGAKIKQSYRLTGNEIISVSLPEEPEQILLPEQMDLQILYEDRDIIVLNKPAGIAVHPAPGHLSGTLVNGLLAYTKMLSSVGAPLRPGIVHRLDKETTGVMVVARNDNVHQALSSQFSSRQVKKTYKCIVVGRVKQDSGKIVSSIGRSESDRKKVSSRTRRGRYSLTEWHVLERFRDYTMLEVILHTGRTHQIRVHLSEAHHPVLGDRVYGGKMARRALPGVEPHHLYLHAEKIGFLHPGNGSFVEFTAPLPDYFVSAIESLRKA